MAQNDKTQLAELFTKHILDWRVFAKFSDGHREDITDNPRYAYLVDKVLKRDMQEIESIEVVQMIIK